MSVEQVGVCHSNLVLLEEAPLLLTSASDDSRLVTRVSLLRALSDTQPVIIVVLHATGILEH